MNTSKAEMREPTYFLLASLLDGPLHGYAIIQLAAELSDGRVRMATGTLYTALDRLTAEGYVRLVSEEIVNGRGRPPYGADETGAGARGGDEPEGGAPRAGDEAGGALPAGRRDPEGAARMSPLERRCRSLLR